MSMVSWLTFMFFGGPKERLLCIKLPSPNLKPDFAGQARTFINGVADRALGQTVTGGGASSRMNDFAGSLVQGRPRRQPGGFRPGTASTAADELS
jgi:hypothetical protein